MDKAKEYFLKRYDETENGNEKQAYGNLYVWLATAKDTEYAKRTLEKLNAPLETLKTMTCPDLVFNSCPNCRTTTMLYNQDGEPNMRCGMCGQLLKWNEDELEE